MTTISAALMKPKVSVVVPVYNSLPYLREALESLKSQTLPDIEFLLINDGSTDGSLAALEACAHEDDRFAVHSFSNGGYGTAMNRGMSLARGKYVSIFEPDDYIDPTMYETLYNAAETYSADIVRSDAILFYGDAPQRTFIPPKQTLKSPYIVEDLQNATSFPTGPLFQTWTGLYKRKLISDLMPIYHETPGALFQDSGFWFNIYSIATTYVYLPKALYYYRRDNASSSTNRSGGNDAKARGIINEFILTGEDMASRSGYGLSHFICATYWAQLCQASYSAMWLAASNATRKEVLSLVSSFMSSDTANQLRIESASPTYKMVLRLITRYPKLFASLCKFLSAINNRIAK